MCLNRRNECWMKTAARIRLANYERKGQQNRFSFESNGSIFDVNVQNESKKWNSKAAIQLNGGGGGGW